MSPKSKLELRASEIRTKLAELAGAEEMTEEVTTEIRSLRAEYVETETRIQALTVAGDEPTRTPVGETADGEAKERDELRAKVRIGSYAKNAMEQRSAADGPEREFNASVGMADNAFPLELLCPRHEVRAATNTDTTTQPRRWLDRLFADTAAKHLGVTFESVAPGVASFPVTSTGGSPVQRGRTEAVTASTWTIGVSELKPTRKAIHVVYSEEDRMRIPGLSDALERDMRMALTERCDRTIFVGDSGANENTANITGLQTASITEVTLRQANKIKAPETLAEFAGMIDGVHAAGFGDLRVVTSVGAWRLWESTIINSAADNMTLAAFLRMAGMSWMSRGEIDTNTANNDFGAFVGRGRGIEGAAVAAIWNAGMMTVDPYSGATSGEIQLTLSYFWNFGIPRTANLQRLKFVT